MKNLTRIMAVIGLFSISQLVFSQAITDTYSTGQTLTADTLNTIKNAVNDNAVRIEANSAVSFLVEPAVSDDINSYPLGSVWIDTSADNAYILIDGTPGAAVWKLITSPPTPIYSIGDVGPAGGIVFYVTGGGLHGLEAAPSDQGLAEWGCGGTVITGADGTAIGAGAQNTGDILTGCMEPSIAARIANNFWLNGYNDWYLPSSDELNLVYDNIGPSSPMGNVNGFDNGRGYWSSSEVNSGSAVNQFFGDGSQAGLAKGVSNVVVRAVRAF